MVYIFKKLVYNRFTKVSIDRLYPYLRIHLQNACLNGSCFKNKLFYSEEKVLCSEDKHLCSEEKVLCSEEKVPCSEDKLLCSEEKVPCSEDKLFCSEEKVLCSEDKLFYSEEKPFCLEREVGCFTKKVIRCKKEEFDWHAIPIAIGTQRRKEAVEEFKWLTEALRFLFFCLIFTITQLNGYYEKTPSLYPVGIAKRDSYFANSNRKTTQGI